MSIYMIILKSHLPPLQTNQIARQVATDLCFNTQTIEIRHSPTFSDRAITQTQISYARVFEVIKDAKVSFAETLEHTMLLICDRVNSVAPGSQYSRKQDMLQCNYSTIA
jgi:hypothetical protein